VEDGVQTVTAKEQVKTGEGKYVFVYREKSRVSG
jgi:hypothetical protein